MNDLSKNIKNHLIITNGADYLQQLYKLCLERVKAGRLVVIITSVYYDFSKLLVELNITKDQLKNFIIMYNKKIDDISHKLLSLHSWSLLPSVVVVDLLQLLDDDLGSSTLLVKKVVLCAVSLLAYLESVAVKLSANAVYGFLILRSVGENFGDAQIQTIKDLYFYKMELYEDLDGVRALLQKTGEL